MHVVDRHFEELNLRSLSENLRPHFLTSTIHLKFPSDLTIHIFHFFTESLLLTVN